MNELDILYKLAKAFRILPIKPDAPSNDSEKDEDEDTTVWDELKIEMGRLKDLNTEEFETLFEDLYAYYDTKGIDNLANIFTKGDLLTDLDGLGSAKWADIIGIADLTSWVMDEGGFFDAVRESDQFHKFIMDLIVRVLNAVLGSIPFNPYTAEFDEEEDKIVIVLGGSDDVINEANFTMEQVLYKVVRNARRIICDAIGDIAEFADKILPNQLELFLPFFSGFGIRIAYKQDGMWTYEATEWPETIDPFVFHAYFKLPHIPIFDLAFMEIPNHDLSKENVYFRSNGVFSKSKKYKTFDLVTDILGFGSLVLVSYILANLGMKEQSDKLVRSMDSASDLAQVNAATMVINNVVNMNKGILNNMAGILAVLNGLFTSVNNTSTINAYLSALNLPEMPVLELEPSGVDEVSSDVSAIESDIVIVKSKLEALAAAIGLKLLFR